MATMTGAHAANENDKIAPPHGSPSSRCPYPISQRCVVHHSNFGALCRLGVIQVESTRRRHSCHVRYTSNSDHIVECALGSGQVQAAFLTGCYACRYSYCAWVR